MSQDTPSARVVVFTGGPTIQRDVLSFVAELQRHPAIELAAIFSESPLRGMTGNLRDLWRRRGILAVPLLVQQALSASWRAISGPAKADQRILGMLADRTHYVDRLHAPEVLTQVRESAPDIGLVYGGPIVRECLFAIPRLGTLGIHHGSVPDYRGKKTTFWALYNGEEQVGVTIQRINNKLDGGDIVAQAHVAVAGRMLPTVKQELERIGIQLYLQSIRAIADGSATFTPQPRGTDKLYKDPKPSQIAQFWFRYLQSRMQSPKSSDHERICLVTETFHPVTGGGERQAKALALGLANSGMTVQVVTRQTSRQLPKRATLGEVSVRRIPPSGVGTSKKWVMALTTFIILLRLARSYDAILVCGYRVLGVPAIAAGWIVRKPCILKADLLGEYSGAIFQRRLKNLGVAHQGPVTRGLLKLRSRMLAHAHKFVAISSPVQEELVAGGVQQRKIAHIPNSVDTMLFSPAEPEKKAALRRKLGIPTSRQLAIYTGRLETTKGLPTLLTAWPAVLAHHPNVQLLLVGGGGVGSHNCEAQLRDEVVRKGLASSVSFAGSVENVHEYLQAADVFVFPSEREAFGLSVVEAMACGLPVVSTNPGGLADIVSQGETAFVVPVDNPPALAQTIALALDGQQIEMAANARTMVLQRYSQDKVVEQYRQLLLQVLERDAIQT